MSYQSSNLVWAPETNWSGMSGCWATNEQIPEEKETMETSNQACCKDKEAVLGVDTPSTGYTSR